MLGYVYVALLVALTALSLRSLAVLGGAAPFTSFGWLFTIAYDLAASLEIVKHRHLPLHLPYAFLALLALAFAVAGARDEPQAEPWWWPHERGKTRAEKRAAGALSEPPGAAP